MTNKQGIRLARVLLVEDNPADVRLFEEMARDCGLRLALDIVTDGETALVRLLSPPEDGAADLVLLDLDLPGMNGLELLQALQAHTPPVTVPIVVLTSSEEHITAAADLRVPVDRYMTKPVLPLEFLQVLSQLGSPQLSLVVVEGDPVSGSPA